MNHIRVFIADDHALMREGLKRLFALTRDIVPAGEAADGAEMLARLPRSEADLLLLDMTMPGSSGEDLIARIRARHPALPVLIVSMHDEPEIAQRALLAGASGYVTKDSEPGVLIDAIRKVAAGKRFLDRVLSGRMTAPRRDACAPKSHEALSSREFEILGLLSGGMTVNEIARRLELSNRTVSSHKMRMMGKMGFSSNADIVKYGMTYGLANEMAS